MIITFEPQDLDFFQLLFRFWGTKKHVRPPKSRTVDETVISLPHVSGLFGNKLTMIKFYVLLDYKRAIYIFFNEQQIV